MANGLLSGFCVVEVAHPLTEYAGLVLANLGADVFLVEPPEGAATRKRNPRVPDSGDSKRGSIAFLARNTNKKSVVIDLGQDDDRLLLEALIERADTVLDADQSPFHEYLTTSAKPRAGVTVTDKLGLGNSALVGFAASGGLASSGWPQQPPCNAPSFLALDGTSIYAGVMALVAAYARRRGAAQVRYEVPHEEAAVASLTPWTRPLHSYGLQAAGQGVKTMRMGAGGLPIYKAKDGFVRVLAVTPKQWQAFVELLDSPEALVDGPFTEPTFRRENEDALVMMCEEITTTRTVEELFLRGQALGLTISPVYTLNEFHDDPHVRGRSLFVAVDDPEFGSMELMRTPLVVDPAPENVDPVPAPGLDEHRDEACAFVAQGEAAESPVSEDFDVTKPLDGTRVLELGVGAVVPEAASLLALLGADVIKVESIVRVDFLRQMGLAGFMDVNNSPMFNQLNLGVRSVAMDMNDPESIALIQGLCASCDVVMENMRGGIVDRWDLDYAGAKRMRDDIVYLSSQGLGRGIYDGFQTYGPNLQTFSGVTSQWSHPDDPFPVGTTLNHPDHVAGKQALMPLLAAMLRRQQSGAGAFLDATQVEAAATLITDRLLEQSFTDEDLEPLGNRSRDMAPHGCYPCTGEDSWIAIAVEDDAQWVGLAGLVGESWTRDPALASSSGRLQHAAAIDAHLRTWTRPQSVADLEANLRQVGVCASRVVTGDDIAGNEQAHESGFFAAVAHPTSGTRFYTGTPVLLEGHGRPATLRPPLLGEHTERILYDELGLAPARVDALTAKKAVGH